MLNKTLIDDFGQLRLCRKWYRDGSHIIHRTGGEMIRRESTVLDTGFDDELGCWVALAVWKDSPESGPRMEYAL
jgi:hypothetical protein